MPKNNEIITQKKFNKITIGLSSPEVILGNSRGKFLNLKLSIIELISLNVMVYSVREFLVP